jgi:hypothetical protein
VCSLWVPHSRTVSPICDCRQAHLASVLSAPFPHHTYSYREENRKWAHPRTSPGGWSLPPASLAASSVGYSDRHSGWQQGQRALSPEGLHCPLLLLAEHSPTLGHIPECPSANFSARASLCLAQELLWPGARVLLCKTKPSISSLLKKSYSYRSIPTYPMVSCCFRTTSNAKPP